jgi:hypothetical protein
MEVSLHLCQPAVYQALASPITAGAGVTATVTTTAAMYPGAQLLAGASGASDTEVITILSVPNGTQFTANFANNHAAAEPVWGATFPVQYQTDPIFTQSEMLGYLSRAQNEFLVAVPMFYQRFFQNISTNVIVQSLPANAVLLDRIAASQVNIPITSLVRASNVVTLTAVQPTNLAQYNTLSVVNAADTSFNGVFAVSTSPLPDVITYPQIGPDASTTGGNIQQMSRLYELTQEELVMRDRAWQTGVGFPSAWYEDRVGLYKWGVDVRPDSTYPCELLVAIRDSDTLGLTDGFLIPDPICHGMKYLALAYAWSKDGVAQQPKMAELCMKRYAQVVMATQRYIGAMKMAVGR